MIDCRRIDVTSGRSISGKAKLKVTTTANKWASVASTIGSPSLMARYDTVNLSIQAANGCNKRNWSSTGQFEIVHVQFDKCREVV